MLLTTASACVGWLALIFPMGSIALEEQTLNVLLAHL